MQVKKIEHHFYDKGALQSIYAVGNSLATQYTCTHLFVVLCNSSWVASYVSVTKITQNKPHIYITQCYEVLKQITLLSNYNYVKL